MLLGTIHSGLASAARPRLCQYAFHVARLQTKFTSKTACCGAHLNGTAVVDHKPLASTSFNGDGHDNGYNHSYHTSNIIYGRPTLSELEAVETYKQVARDASHGHAPGQHLQAAPSTSSAAPSTSSGPGWPAYKYPRVLLKISGEALQGKQSGGIDPAVLNHVAEEIAEAHRAGLQLAVVVGGGNYFRGATAPRGMDRAQADYVGMLATVMNALLLQGALETLGVETRVQTAIEMREVAEPYIRRRAIRHLEENRVVIFGAGTGNPFFTTDTAAALRATEMNADVFMKATKVDGVYDCDPMKHQHAKKYDKLSYRQVSVDNLQVMDETAITLCKENNIPVLVFNVMDRGNVLRAARGENVGTVVASEDVKAH